jgi:hypothetical protein
MEMSKCSDHPDAPHGFARNASHNAGEYVCECEGRTPMKQHIYPTNDIKPHNTDDGECWCNPTIDEEDNLVIHNAMDQREQYEEGRLPS